MSIKQRLRRKLLRTINTSQETGARDRLRQERREPILEYVTYMFTDKGNWFGVPQHISRATSLKASCDLVCKWKLLSRVQLCKPVDYTVHGILQVRILEWVAFLFSRGSSQTRDRTQVSHIAGRFFTSWATRGSQGYWSGYPILSPVDLPDPEIEAGSPALQADSLLFYWAIREVILCGGRKNRECIHHPHSPVVKYFPHGLTPVTNSWKPSREFLAFMSKEKPLLYLITRAMTRIRNYEKKVVSCLLEIQLLQTYDSYQMLKEQWKNNAKLLLINNFFVNMILVLVML